jgi:hypothetical protein
MNISKSFESENDDTMRLPVSHKENDTVTSYENITQIDAIKGKDVISFKKISINDIGKYNYREITSDAIKGGISNIVAGGAQIAAISVLNPGGLFTATVSPQLLTTFANGTFSTMVHEGGRIVSHAGFKAISPTVFAPIAIMQFLSMVTGQYYMHGITKQLQSISKKIDILINFHHAEKSSKLENAQELLKQLYNTQYPGIEHLTQLKAIEMEVGSIYREYLKHLEYNIKKDSMKEYFKHMRPIVVGSFVFPSVKLFLEKNFNKHLIALYDDEDENTFSFNFYMVTTADEILHLIPIIEFMINVKMNEQTDRNHQIEELFSKISKYTENDFFANSTGKNVLNDHYTPFIEMTKYIVNHIIMNHMYYLGVNIERLREIEKRKDYLESNVLEASETLNIKTKLVEQMTTPIEILYSINENGKNIVYVKQ